jgi:hypothetical protein
MVSGFELMTGAASAGLTVTSWADEAMVSGATEPSVTVAQYHVLAVRPGRPLNV